MQNLPVARRDHLENKVCPRKPQHRNSLTFGATDETTPVPTGLKTQQEQVAHVISRVEHANVAASKRSYPEIVLNEAGKLLDMFVLSCFCQTSCLRKQITVKITSDVLDFFFTIITITIIIIIIILVRGFPSSCNSSKQACSCKSSLGIPDNIRLLPCPISIVQCSWSFGRSVLTMQPSS